MAEKQKTRKSRKPNVKRRARTKLVIFVLFAALTGYILFYGIPFGNFTLGGIKDHMHYGLDLTGGINVVLEATEENATPTEDEMEATAAALKNRIDTMGVSEATVAVQDGDRIRVSIPSITNQQEALDMIGKTAKLEFLSPDGDVLLTGDDVESAKAVKQSSNSGIDEYVVALTFTDEGTEKFAKATETYLNQTISIVLDDETISSPTVNSTITNGQAVIEGMDGVDEASELANLIQGGALPVTLEPIQVTTVGPTLGADSLDQSILAGAIGIGAVLIFMLIVYRGLGLIADIALICFIMIDLWLMSELNVTLTLPGIAGFILTVGMAVDANVIIFERIKDEMAQGRKAITAIQIGFKRAMGTIMDSNITTLIAGFVLFFMGSGSVQGFAVTLVLGIFISLFTAVFVTRWLTKLVIEAKIGKNLLGLKKVEVKA